MDSGQVLWLCCAAGISPFIFAVLRPFWAYADEDMLFRFSKTRFFFVAGGLLLYALQALITKVYNHEGAAQNRWLEPAFFARSNSKMEIVSQGHGPFVKMKRKIRIESDKSLIFGKSENQTYTFIVGLNDPKLFQGGSEALIGLRQGGIAELEIWKERGPRPRARIKILEICEESLKTDVCITPQVDQTYYPVFQDCHQPTSAKCEKLLDQTIYNRKTESPEYPLVEYCAFYPESFCFKLVEAVAILSRTKSDMYQGLFNGAIFQIGLFITRHQRPEFESLVLGKGSPTLAAGMIEDYYQNTTPEKLRLFFQSTHDNPIVRGQLVERIVRSLEEQDYRSGHLRSALMDVKEELPIEILTALERQNRISF